MKPTIYGKMPAASLGAALLAVLALSTPAHAQPGWGGMGGWGGYGGGFGGSGRYSAPRDDREGRVDAERFLADGAIPLLGHGRITLRTMPGTTASDREQATFEAAVVDQLAKAGYDTAGPDGDGGQIVEITVVRDQLEPAEEKRNPISGSAMMGVSNRGSMMGLSLAYDATKPRGALVMTNMEIRIRDRASGKALYEARARIATREGTKAASDDAVSVRLAGALFERFPSSSLASR
ncbi:hypothetical protein J2X73_003355 [Novosphingobium sp. 1748]|uniref:hypothetical protein n=1 Tax=unclassified Novosphingobium TaxID=2644732 RepID=UPI000A56AD2E|nr:MULTISPECIES: hypothetical protein [unclassified Novosphingobium]MBN9145047.1 hypothetical protein [Novosphingobium sp.]MDR6708968.1 hypothetical protein [Novosphingobium sp. 1748]